MKINERVLIENYAVIKAVEGIDYQINNYGTVSNKFGDLPVSYQKRGFNTYPTVLFTFYEQKYRVVIRKLVAYKKFGFIALGQSTSIINDDGDPENSSFDNIRINIGQFVGDCNQDERIDEKVKVVKKTCLDEIFASKIEIGKTKLTVGEFLDVWYGKTSSIYPGLSRVGIKIGLEEIGLRPVYDDGNLLYIATAHPALRKLLSNVGYGSSYSGLIQRLPNYISTRGPTSFAGSKKRFLMIKIV
jgi:hypothetical protein